MLAVRAERCRAARAGRSGTITVDEMRDGLRTKGSKIPESELQRIMENADVNGDGAAARHACCAFRLCCCGGMHASASPICASTQCAAAPGAQAPPPERPPAAPVCLLCVARLARSVAARQGGL